jgi:SAM-dependent methyltransferase
MEYKRRYYPECIYGGFTDVDSTLHFYLRVNSIIKEPAVILDIGCGRGQYSEDPIKIRKDLQILCGNGRQVIGIDIDHQAEQNPYLDEFRLLDGNGPWPIESASIDLCLSDWSLEHIQDPELFFSESWRVLKPGGILCIRTSNLYHYRSIIARVIPERFHQAILKIAQKGTWRKDEDVFPTVYRCNTIGKIKKMLSKHQFEDIVVYGFQSEPAYLSFSRLAYRLGVIYQRLIPKVFAITIFSFAKKG